MKAKFLSIALILLLSGCATIPAATTLTETEYKTQFGEAVCLAIEKLNEKGILSDSEKLASEFESTLQDSMVELGFDMDDMLAAKTAYLTYEESEKLLRLHFTWCLMNAGLEDSDSTSTDAAN